MSKKEENIFFEKYETPEQIKQRIFIQAYNKGLERMKAVRRYLMARIPRRKPTRYTGGG